MSCTGGLGFQVGLRLGIVALGLRVLQACGTTRIGREYARNMRHQRELWSAGLMVGSLTEGLSPDPILQTLL